MVRSITGIMSRERQFFKKGYVPSVVISSLVSNSLSLSLHEQAEETSGTRYRGTVWEHKIQQLYGDSAAFDYTPYQGKIDFVFVDGSHTPVILVLLAFATLWVQNSRA